MDKAMGKLGGHCPHDGDNSRSERVTQHDPKNTFQLCCRLDCGGCIPTGFGTPASLSGDGAFCFGLASESLGAAIVAEASDMGTGVGTTELFSEGEMERKESASRFPTSK